MNARKEALVADTLEAIRKLVAALKRDYFDNKAARGKALEAVRVLFGGDRVDKAVADEETYARAVIAPGQQGKIRQAWEDVRFSSALVYAWYLAARDSTKAGKIRAEVIAKYKALGTGFPEMEAANRKS